MAGMLKWPLAKSKLVMWHFRVLMQCSPAKSCLGIRLNVLLLALTLVYINQASGACNVCQANQAACVNSTSFYLCFGEKEPHKNVLYHCKDGFDCTDLKAICVQTSSQRPPSCGDTSSCGMCSAHRNYLFACLSRTTFQMCYGATRPIGQIGYCPIGYVCHSGSDAVCVLEGSVANVTCDIADNDGPVPPLISTTEMPINQIMTPTEMCAEERAVGLYPTTPTDPSCRRYISCFYSNGVMRAREYSCPLGTYFHMQQVECVFNKPSYCLS